MIQKVGFVALATTFVQFTGGYKKFIEYYKRVTDDFDITIITTSAGVRLFRREGLTDVKYIEIPTSGKLSFVSNFLLRVWPVIQVVRRLPSQPVVYSTSDFLPDTVGAFLFKRRTASTVWIGSVFHLISNPLSRKGSLAVNVMAYFHQRTSLQLIKSECDLLILDNELLRNKLFDLGIISLGRSIVSPAGVDYSGIAAKREPNHAKPYAACFVAALRPTKGIFDVIAIWKRVTNRFPDAKLIVVGNASEKTLHRVQGKIAEFGLSDNVILKGFIKETEQLYEIMRLSRMLLTTSYEEGWGIVIAEAMSSGIPVVAYDLPVFRSVFKDTLCTVPLGSIDQFATKVIALLGNESLGKELVKKADRLLPAYDYGQVARIEAQSILEIVRKANRLPQKL